MLRAQKEAELALRILDDDVEEIRRRTDIVEVISGYLQLRKAGKILKGLCCFHQEKTPSFTVDPGKQLFYCHGCGAGGDAFTFLRRVEGFSFSEAAQRLADKAGIPLRMQAGRSEGGGRKRLLEASGEAAAFFAALLRSSPEAAEARAYLEKRGFSEAEAAAWGLGFSPRGRDTAFRHLLEKKYSAKEIVDAGLAMVGEGGGHRDRFRGRLMFPIADVGGQMVGFGARALGDDAPKYLNSPETAIYHKARILYGLDRAKRDISNEGVAVITEGYTDVIALSHAGATNAVATCGTALGEDHFSLLKRFCDRVVLAFDADQAGAVASERGFGIHHKVGLEVLVAPLPEGKDPADVALGGTPEEVRDIIASAVPLMRFVLEAAISRHRLETPEGKARALAECVDRLRWEPNRIARGEHAFWLARRIGVDPSAVQVELAEASGVSTVQRAPSTRLPGHIKVEREALAILLDSPSRLRSASEWVTGEHFTQPDHKVLLEAMIRRGDTGDPAGSLMAVLPDEDFRRLAAELAMTEVTASDAEEVFLRLEEFRLKRRITELRATLDEIDEGSEPKRHNEVFEELVLLERQRRKFEER